jgi:hypothetical protein
LVLLFRIFVFESNDVVPLSFWHELLAFMH